MRPQRGFLRLVLALALLLGALALVVRRQSQTLEALRELEEIRRQSAVLEAERAELLRQAHGLESRSQVLAAAAGRLGMYVPAGPELVILSLPPERPAPPEPRGWQARAF